MNSRYHEVYDGWKHDPEGFWAEAAGAIDWVAPWDKVFDPDLGVYGRWFVGAECNTCFNAVDRHVAGGRADQVALIHDSAITGAIAKYTYAELKREVVALASVLKNQGVRKGDRVIIYMPMVAEAAFAMLACARIGAIHSVVFGGFRGARTRHPHRRCATRSSSFPLPAASSLAVSSPTSRCSTAPSGSPATSRSAVSSCSGRSNPAN